MATFPTFYARYGDWFEFWFDGGAHGPEQGGPDVLSVVERHQPEAVFYHNLQRADARWGGSESGPPEVRDFPRFGERKLFVVDRPGSVQSEIRIGQVGTARSTPDFFPLKVFNTVLGGAFTSRLMLNLREEQGFTYGVRSRFSFRRKRGPFGISMAVATDVTAPAIREAFSELEGLLHAGATEQEVERARDYIAGVFPLQLETTGQVAARMTELQVYDLPDDYFQSYRDRIRDVTPEAALIAGRQVINPQELVIVVAGDAESVRGPLEELELGPVEVVSDS